VELATRIRGADLRDVLWRDGLVLSAEVVLHAVKAFRLQSGGCKFIGCVRNEW
jgi:hypothetical protein